MEMNYPKYSEDNSGHKDSFEEGNMFQDFVCLELAKEGIILQNINSKKFQYEVGENIQGFEIKVDNRFNGYYPKEKPPTNQLSIEIAEKTRIELQNYTPSGIYRNDNSWIYIQGNPKCFYLFGKKLLRQLHKSGRYKEHILPTVKKFYLPLEDADKYCLRKFIKG
ncbi:MAG: hypothetical protein IPJ03_22300 [Ignavibacteriales bacterium]|nr:hypothetical protein [Ignavibacteriales bacterium]